MMKLTPRQKKILNRLLDKFEDSRTYAGENRVEQSFRISPTEIWPGYLDDFVDIAEVEEFEREIRALSDSGLIEIEEAGGSIRRIRAVKERIRDLYGLLGRREKNELLEDEEAMYRGYSDADGPLGEFCRAQLELIKSGRKAKYPADKAAILLKLLDVILRNDKELYERELSIRVLHDSKRFAEEFRAPACDILRKYGDYEELLQYETAQRAIQEIILDEHLICANPGYVYVKGAAEITMNDGSTLHTKERLPMAFSSDFMKEVRSVRVEAARVITIENLTSFHRFDREDFFAVYLSGYHSIRITRFLNSIENPGSHTWLHFGDIDPDGFMILMNLCRKTGLGFVPWRMDAGILRQYRDYARPLTDHDRSRAQRLLEKECFPEEMKLMLAEGIKLEQEAVDTEEGD